MDSLTQASLGALCGEMVLGRKLGYKGALWGILFGTLPDLDVLAYGILSATEQLIWHRGISHSILMMFVASFLLAPLLKKVHRTKEISYWRYFFFIFLAWSTHVLIDCFNTYGTQIFEPFSSYRVSFSNISIIDIFFLLPLLAGLFLATVIYRKHRALRSKIGWLTTAWLCVYFLLSLTMKLLATAHFKERMADQNIDYDELITSPTFSNIFLWRMAAKDDQNYYISYWSLFDSDDRAVAINTFTKNHELEQGYEESIDFQRLKWFSQGWHQLFKLPNEPNTLYIAPMNMSEIHIASEDSGSNQNELRPAFMWKITKSNNEFILDRSFKVSKDGKKVVRKAVNKTYQRILGNEPNWMSDKWTWEINDPSL